ncbi:MAG: hypothetical protein ACK4TA_09935 [Saprospiraceae bacterium]
MRHRIQNLLTLICAGYLLASCAPKPDNEALNPSLFAHLSQPEVLEMTLETDWHYLVENKAADLALPVTVRWGKEQIPAEISVRGHARRNICAFPPLKLKFSEENLASRGLNPDYKSLKLVTHCINGNNDLVLREFLTYKMLNTLTDNSFRVQLAKVTYQDAQGSTEAYAFIIENNEEMAERLGGELIEDEPSELTAINADQYNLMAVFQYMIGNTDWNMTKQHNIKLVNKGHATAPLPIPYDFDYSGMVNAHYALPPAKLPIKSVRERFFQWRGKNTSDLPQTLERFRAKREALYDLVINFELLSMESRLDMMSYLDSFYKNMPQAPRLASR